MQHFSWLLARLDAFIRKFYLNQLLRGILILLSCLIAYILIVSFGEYYLYLPVWARVSIISAFGILGGAALIFWIIVPLLRMAKLGKILSHEQAAVIVGRHFPEISDKLLNVLQLRNDNQSGVSRELIEASIDQKASQISVIPITNAVDLKKNRRYLPVLLPLIAVAVFVLVISPKVFTDAGTRLLRPTTHFEKPAPFRFEILNEPLLVTRNNDFVLKIRLSGDALPAALSVAIGDEQLPAIALSNHIFQYSFRNVTEAQNFRLYAAGFYSASYTLKVAQLPQLKAIRLQLDYPDYTGRKDEMRNSLGDLSIPQGTRVSYGLMAEYTDAAKLIWGSGATVSLANQGGKLFGYQHRFMRDTSYAIVLENGQVKGGPSFNYKVQVIPDQYPVVQVQEFRDTVTGRQIVLTGTAGDDYGVSKVVFHYNISDANGRAGTDKTLLLHGAGGAMVPFQQYFDLQSLNLQPGQKVDYFVEAWDNDGVNGAKAARSALMSYHMYTPKQLDSAINMNSKQINAGLSNSASQSKEIQKDLQEAQDKMLQSDGSSFEQQQNLKDLAEKQQQLQAQMEATKKRLEEQKIQSMQKEYSEEIKEKQDDVAKQLDNLLNNELKEQMRKLQEMMAKMNKDELQRNMEQMQEQNKLFNMDMQRMQELMKQLEAQMRMEDLANKIDQLAEKQNDLRKSNDLKKKDNASLAKEQRDLKNELNKALGEDMKELQKLSNGMERKMDMDQPSGDGKKAGEKMDQSAGDLDKNENSKAGESQKDASEALEKMAASLREQAGGMDMKEIDINIRATRQLLTNLIRLSFDQEKLMGEVRGTSASSQSYLANQTQQGRLYQASRMIRDSLFSLSKRVSMLAPTINKETIEVEKNMKLAAGAIENRRIGDALTRQQYVMTHANNLALMLNELLSNLMMKKQQGMKSGKGSPSSGACKKPGAGAPTPGAGQQLSDIITQQQQLGNAMQQMQSKPGKSPGQQGKEGKDGKEGQGQGQQQGKDGQGGQGQNGQGQGSEGENANAEQIARLAEQQAAIRRQLQQLQNKLSGTGAGTGSNKELREIQQQMDRNETDLVNRRLSSEFLQRQKEILTRLLETEKSLREQEQDDKRAANAAKQVSRPVPAELAKFLQSRQQLLELYRSAPPQLKPYYRQMVDQYFKTIGTK